MKAPALVLIGSCLLAWMAAGCRSQSEGDRCDVRNGSADCEQGLVCFVPIDQAYCCPPAGEAVSAAVCNVGTRPPEPEPTDAEAGAQPDADTGPSGDAGAEPTADAGADAADTFSPDTSIEPPADAATE
jgi:hypothetical protein